MDPFVGEIRPVGFSFAPVGWAFCDGSILSISEFSVLFALIGTAYGGDGQTTFALPDLRGRVPLGDGQGPGLSPYVQGQRGGAEHVTLTTAQIPAHNHALVGTTGHANSYSPAGKLPAFTARNVYTTASPDSQMTNLEPAGSNLPHENRQPLLTVNFIIALYGVFPSRN